MTQLAWGMMGQTPGRPACRNPHDPERVPGGSSSGSAVAVAAGIVDHAPGTDAGGSVRHPAAACGVVGFKPTYGAVPLDGCMPYAPSFDTGGAIARTVAEAALQYSVIAAVPLADLAGGLEGLRVGFLGGYFTAALEDDVAAMLERARARVRAREIDIGWSQTDNRSMGPIFTAEPGAYVLAHDQSPATDALPLRPGDARRRRGGAHAAGDRVPARHARAGRGAAALRGRRRGLRHPARGLGAVRARAHRRARQDDAHERAHEAVQRARLARPRAARRQRPRRPAAEPAGRRPARAATTLVLRAAAALEGLLAS